MMSDTVTFTRITGTAAAPAVWQEGWLPDLDVFPELTEAREKAQRLRAAWDTAAGRRRDVEARIEAYSEQRKATMRDAYLHGESSPQVKDESEKLAAELVEAKEHAQAAGEAFTEHLNDCIGLVIEHRDEWQSEIEAFDAGVASQMRVLVAQMTELRSRRDHHSRLAHWIERTVRGGELPAEHFPYSEVIAPLPGDQQAEDARLQEAFERSYAGGLAPERRATDAEARALEAQALAPQPQPVTDAEPIVVDYAELDDEDLVDWLMGTGGFDGQPKPTAQQVISVAEGDVARAGRLLEAERVAGGDAVRQDLLDRLGEISNGKAGT
jgi:hypothetical protein